MSKHQNKADIVYIFLKQPEALTAERFYEISNESYTYGSPWSIEQFEGTFEPSNLFYIVAEIDNVIVGFLGASIVQGEVEIYNIAVADSHKRKGIGTELIQKLKQVIKSKQADVIYLEVRISNKAAILLYKHLNFHPVGMRPNYYSNPREDAVLLKCTI